MNDEALAQIDKAVDHLRPEAREYVTHLDGIHLATTKDSYGNVLAFLSGLGDAQGAALFLIAMVGEGYPLVTADQLATLFGWPSTVHQLLRREYLKVGAA